MEFLLRELNGKRPLLPPDLPMTPEVGGWVGGCVGWAGGWVGGQLFTCWVLDASEGATRPVP